VRRASGKVKKSSSHIFQECPSQQKPLPKCLPCSFCSAPEHRADRREGGEGRWVRVAWIRVTRAAWKAGHRGADAT